LYENGKIQELEADISNYCLGLESSSYEEERKTKEDLDEVSYRKGTERRKDVEAGEEVKTLAADRYRWKSFAETLCS
jgi:hypothetical protein